MMRDGRDKGITPWSRNSELKLGKSAAGAERIEQPELLLDGPQRTIKNSRRGRIGDGLRIAKGRPERFATRAAGAQAETGGGGCDFPPGADARLDRGRVAQLLQPKIEMGLRFVEQREQRPRLARDVSVFRGETLQRVAPLRERRPGGAEPADQAGPTAGRELRARCWFSGRSREGHGRIRQQPTRRRGRAGATRAHWPADNPREAG